MPYYLVNLRQAEIADDKAARIHLITLNRSNNSHDFRVISFRANCRLDELRGPILIVEADNVDKAIETARSWCGENLNIVPCRYCIGR